MATPLDPPESEAPASDPLASARSKPDTRATIPAESDPLVSEAKSQAHDPWRDFAVNTPTDTWVPDILAACEHLTLELGDDDEGPIVATLTRYCPGGSAEPDSPDTDHLPAVLSLHGWTDYFYNTELADTFYQRGHPFYALDLRKYGRSLRDYQTPGHIEDLTEYDAEIEIALGLIQQKHPDRMAPIIHGHSTGGLVAALWADRHPRRVSALVLNSPWLELPGHSPARSAAEGIVSTLNVINPRTTLRLFQWDAYWQSLSLEAHGEWDLHPLWRPRTSFAMTSGWLKAVFDGHKAIYQGLHIAEPVLTMLSTNSILRPQWSQQHQRADAVLDVELLARRAHKLGTTVTVVRIEGAMHDVFTSGKEVRQEAFSQLDRWLRGYVA